MALTVVALSCPQCGGAVGAETKICEYCGAVVALSEDRAEFLVIGLACPRCRFNNQHGERFCGQCSTPLVVPCPRTRCHADNSVWRKFCSRCGENITEARGLAASSDFARYSRQIENYELQLDAALDRLRSAKSRERAVKVFIGTAVFLLCGLAFYAGSWVIAVAGALGFLFAFRYKSSEIANLRTVIEMCETHIARLRDNLATIQT